MPTTTPTPPLPGPAPEPRRDGEGPVPMAVWPTLPDHGSDPVDLTRALPPLLAQRLIAVYTNPGDTVWAAGTGAPALAAAAAELDRHILTDSAPAPGHGRVRLLVLTPGAVTASTLDLANWTTHLLPAGLLVVVVPNTPGAGAVLAGRIVAAADQAGLGYLQHVVAITAAVDGDTLTPRPNRHDVEQALAAHAAGLPIHLPVHADLLVFTAPDPTPGARPADPPPAPDGGVGDLPGSVWAVGQRPSRTQRRGRYLAASNAHPGKMLPALAAHAIAAFTEPGDVVLDPMCGIGTTLVEAAHQGRHSIGIEYEPRWARLAGANLDHARTQGATGTGDVLVGDARRVAATLADQYGGRVRLVLTSPPYGSSTHGQVHAQPGHGVAKWHHSYGTDRTNLARRTLPDLLDGFTHILIACRPLLRPDGVLVITTRPWRRGGLLVDFPTAVLDAAVSAGYQPVQRCVALLAALRDGRLITRASFFQLHETRRHRANGRPAHVIAHEDVLILRATPTPAAEALALSEPLPPAHGNGEGRQAA